MAKPVFRGLLVAAFFAITLFVLIPPFVPRPAFIPGFAPPPDMWPRTVCITGIALGLISALAGVLGPRIADEPVETDGSSRARMIARFIGVVACFAMFLIVVPYVGFLVGTIALTLAAILMTGERSRWLWTLLLAVGGPILIMMFFHSVLGTQFPKGLLTKPFGF
jgi:putative tricarboxylic transport membrane protein